MAATIRVFEEADRNALIALWERCELTRPWNNPSADIDRKVAVDPSGLLVVDGPVAGELIGSAMVGYEGHRGWVNYVGVDPAHRRRGLAGELMTAAESWLLERGCPKLNFQIRRGNQDAIAFYEARGYQVDDVVSMGRRLIPDD